MKNQNPDGINALESDYLYIQPSQLPCAGNGLFTAVKIFKDEIVAVFHGKTLTDAQAAQRVNLNDDQYFMNLPNGRIFDAKNTSGFAKYANDANGSSKNSFTNNTKITLDEKQRIVLVATRNIAAASEIFCSYGKKYWNKHKPSGPI